MHQTLQKRADYGNFSYKSDLPRMVAIAPAPVKNYDTIDLQTEGKRYNYKSSGYNGTQAASIARRNARERNRVKQVNDGFNALRKRLPATVIAALSGGARRGSGKKLSKVDTLRMVVEYIRYLQNILEESDASLGVKTVQSTSMEATYEIDEGVFAGRVSPYSDSVPSPADSECSSGVSSAYSLNNGCIPNQYNDDQMDCMDDNELLDAITWWQQK